MELILLFASFLVLVFLAVPISTAMLAASILSILTSGLPGVIAADKMLNSMNSFPLMAVPFFILAGNIMNQAGLTHRLVAASKAIVGHYYGGTAQVNVVTNIVFAGISGSATADGAAIGTTLVPAMKKEGYGTGFAAGLTAAASMVGPVIPPSIGLIVYATIAELSVARLFLAGIGPGFAMGIALMIYVAIVSRRRGYPKSERMPWGERIPVLTRALPAVAAPVILVGGIVTGLYTATEGGVVACVYGVLLGLFVYKDLRLKDIPTILLEAAQMTAVSLFILSTAMVFGFLLTVHGFSDVLISLIHYLDPSPTGLILLFVGFFLLVGMFVEGMATMIIFVPVLIPFIAEYNLDPVHLALIIHVAILVSMITPPVGIMLYIEAAIAKIPVHQVEVIPFVATILAVILLMVFFPPLVTFIPNYFMGA